MEDYTSPALLAGATTVDAEQLIELIDTRPDAVLVDSRTSEDHHQGNIEGSQHLIDSETNCKTLAGMLSGKDTPVIFYCNGVKCDRSDNAVTSAVDCGYTEICWFRGGIEEWRAKNYLLVE